MRQSIVASAARQLLQSLCLLTAVQGFVINRRIAPPDVGNVDPVVPPPSGTNTTTAPSLGREQPRRTSLILGTKDISVKGVNVKATVFNDSQPGPGMRFYPGDTVLINVINDLDVPDTVHWHGLSQDLTPFADGTMASQWPIAPGKSFEYEIHLTERDIGTRFYHTHMGISAANAYGAFIVEDPEAPFQWDDERVIMLGDAWVQEEGVILHNLLAPRFVWPGNPNVTMVNGKGVAMLPDNTTTEPAIIDVEYSKRYLFRYIGSQALMYYRVALANHTQTLIEVDGTWLQPRPLDTLEIGAGQRYSTILESKTDEQVLKDGIDGCYWIRLESSWRTPPSNGWAVLRYPGGCSKATSLTPPFTNTTKQVLPTSHGGWISGSLSPLPSAKVEHAPEDHEVSRRYVISPQQIHVTNAQNTTRWAEDGVFFSESSTQPWLIDLYLNNTVRPSYARAMDTSSPRQYEVGYDAETQTWVANAGEVIDIVILNNASALSNQTEVHTWHLHSAKFWHMASGLGDFSEEALAEVRREQYKQPVRKDTMTVFPGLGASSLNKTIPVGTSGAWSMLRYRVEESDAGVWPLHCHLIPHQAMGMMTHLALAPDLLSTRLNAYGEADPNYFKPNMNVLSPYSIKHGSGQGVWEGS